MKESNVTQRKSLGAKRAEKFISRMLEAQEYAAAAMASSQQQMEEQANRKRQPAPLLKAGDKVWLSLKNIQSPQQKKKQAWINAKYSITRIISPHVVELDVPSKIYPKFHVELLRKASEDPLPSQITDDTQPSPKLIPSKDMTFSPEQTVEEILRADKFRRGRGWVRRLLVKWRGFAEPAWGDRADLEDVEELDKFEAEFEAKFGKGDCVGKNEDSRQGPKRSRKQNKINNFTF